jgi:hypothetical protein
MRVGGHVPQDNSHGADHQSGGLGMAPSKGQDYTDNRPPWDWRSKYPPEARKCINIEAGILASALIVLVICAGVALCLSDSFSNTSVPISSAPNSPLMHIDARIIAVFLCGNVGGTTFSIKWLIHSVAKGSWHLDRTYWRFFVPLIGGVYACVMLTLFDSGIIGGHTPDPNRGIASTAALAFLIGYFSDGVSGLLTNIANAVFGTLREK